MAQYAKTTTVSTDRSRAEIEETLERYGATCFAYMRDSEKFAVAFELRDRRIRFEVSVPTPDEYRKTNSGRRRSESSAQDAYSQALRQRWRALVLVIKAKLESVDSGIETFEEAFMPHLVLPNGKTVSQWLVPQIADSYATNKMPPLLSSGNN